MKCLRITAAATALFILPVVALAQTPAMSGPGPGLPPTPQPKVPVPQSMVDQAKAQAAGNFTTMERATVGGQIQTVWDDHDAGKRSVTDLGFCLDCTLKITTREHMVTVVDLSGMAIERLDIGDTRSFQVQLRGESRIAIKPNGFGVDTNLMVYTTENEVFPIYLRAERFNSTNVPDLLVRIKKYTSGELMGEILPNAGREQEAGRETESAQVEPTPVGDQAEAVAGLKVPDQMRKTGDFVQEAPFNPDKLRGWGEYKLWSGGAHGADLKPETVFRDDYFTYIRFGEAWKDLELPTAYVVVDGIDELVNTRVNGRTYIVESTQRLIALKSGQSYLCIEFTGPQTVAGGAN